MTTRTALTRTAQTALLAAIKDGDRYILALPHTVRDAAELRSHGLITVTRSLKFASGQAWKLTENGMLMRARLQHAENIAFLAKLVREEGLEDQDVRDVCASVDEGETSYIGAGDGQFRMNVEMAATLANCSAEDIRCQIWNHLGWGPRG